MQGGLCRGMSSMPHCGSTARPIAAIRNWGPAIEVGIVFDLDGQA
jgi:hypothetical protein